MTELLRHLRRRHVSTFGSKTLLQARLAVALKGERSLPVLQTDNSENEESEVLLRQDINNGSLLLDEMNNKLEAISVPNSDPITSTSLIRGRSKRSMDSPLIQDEVGSEPPPPGEEELVPSQGKLVVAESQSGHVYSDNESEEGEYESKATQGLSLRWNRHERLTTDERRKEEAEDNSDSSSSDDSSGADSSSDDSSELSTVVSVDGCVRKRSRKKRSESPPKTSRSSNSNSTPGHYHHEEKLCRNKRSRSGGSGEEPEDYDNNRKSRSRYHHYRSKRYDDDRHDHRDYHRSRHRASDSQSTDRAHRSSYDKDDYYGTRHSDVGPETLESENRRLKDEREKLAREKEELLKREYERQRADRELIEKEKEELRKTKIHLEEQQRKLIHIQLRQKPDGELADEDCLQRHHHRGQNLQWLKNRRFNINGKHGNNQGKGYRNFGCRYNNNWNNRYNNNNHGCDYRNRNDNNAGGYRSNQNYTHNNRRSHNNNNGSPLKIYRDLEEYQRYNSNEARYSHRIKREKREVDYSNHREDRTDDSERSQSHTPKSEYRRFALDEEGDHRKASSSSSKELEREPETSSSQNNESNRYEHSKEENAKILAILERLPFAEEFLVASSLPPDRSSFHSYRRRHY